VAPTYGRLEGRITIPTGGWTGSVNDSGVGGDVTWTVAAGTYYLTSADTPGGGSQSLIVAFRDALNLAAPTDTLAVTVSSLETGTGLVTITSSGSTTITWVSTDIRDLLGFKANLASGTTWTSDYHARGMWLPNCAYKSPNVVDGNWAGWREADFRAVENAAGYVWAHVGQEKVCNELSWHAISRSKTWIANETTTNASWERFARDCLWGVAAWGTPGGPIRFYPDGATSGTYATYKCPDIRSIKPEHYFAGWAGGPWRISLPRLVQVPGTGAVAVWQLPANASVWAATFPAITTPTSIWGCQETTGTVVDAVAGNNLETAGSGGTYGNTGDPYGRTALGLNGSSSRFTASTSAVLDVTTATSISIFCRIFWSDANGSILVEKREGDGGNDPGYSILAASNEQVNFTVDGDSLASVTAIVAVDQSNTWIDVMGVLDYTLGEVRLYTTGGSDTKSIGAYGSLANTQKFSFGDPGGVYSRLGTLFSYVAVWHGTALTQAEFDKIRGAS